MRKLNKTLILIWSIILPIHIIMLNLCCIITKTENWVGLNIVVITSIIYFSGWITNIICGVASLINSARYERWLEKHPEKQTTTEQLAKDFEDLAKALRDKDKKD